MLNWSCVSLLACVCLFLSILLCAIFFLVYPCCCIRWFLVSLLFCTTTCNHKAQRKLKKKQQSTEWRRRNGITAQMQRAIAMRKWAAKILGASFLTWNWVIIVCCFFSSSSHHLSLLAVSARAAATLVRVQSAWWLICCRCAVSSFYTFLSSFDVISSVHWFLFPGAVNSFFFFLAPRNECIYTVLTCISAQSMVPRAIRIKLSELWLRMHVRIRMCFVVVCFDCECIFTIFLLLIFNP